MRIERDQGACDKRMRNDTEIDWFGAETATFGDRLAGARESSGMTQAQLARNLGIKLMTLKNWEHDVSEPRANKLAMLAGLLNVSVMWLLNGKGEGIDNPETPEGFTQEIKDLFDELREVKAILRSSSDRIGALEKHLRNKLKSEI